MDLEEVYRIAEQCKNYEEFNGYICRLFHDSILTPDYKKETFKLVKNNSVLDDVIKCVDCNDKQMTREADGGILICHCFDKD